MNSPGPGTPASVRRALSSFWLSDIPRHGTLCEKRPSHVVPGYALGNLGGRRVAWRGVT